MSGLDNQQNLSLVVALRYPEAMSVKQQLARDLGVGPAVALSKVIAEQVLRQTLPLDDEYKGYIFYSPEERVSAVEKWLAWARQRATFELNRGTEPGERINNAFEMVLDQRANKVIQVGAFCLEVDRALIQQVFAALDTTDAVVGPSNNGHCYLLGMRVFPDHLMDSVPWDTPNSFKVLCEQFDELGLDFEVLPDAVTIDGAADIEIVPPGTWTRVQPAVREQIRELGFGHLVG